jgi:hypothetical protein
LHICASSGFGPSIIEAKLLIAEILLHVFKLKKIAATICKHLETSQDLTSSQITKVLQLLRTCAGEKFEEKDIHGYNLITEEKMTQFADTGNFHFFRSLCI